MIECNTCGRQVAVDKDGYLANHPPRGTRCNGSGRHIDFVTTTAKV